MKIAAVLAIVALAANANAKILSKMCLEASNPQVVQVKIPDVKEESVAKRVTGSLLAETDQYSESGISRTAHLDIITEKGTVVKIWAMLESTGENISKTRTYGVECDGGRMTLEMGATALKANSDYIAGDAISDEGCNPAMMNFKDLILEKKSCD